MIRWICSKSIYISDNIKFNQINRYDFQREMIRIYVIYIYIRKHKYLIRGIK